MFQKAKARYCNLGVFFSLAFENTDIIGEDNEVRARLANDTVMSHVASPRASTYEFNIDCAVPLTASHYDSSS